jgi:HSP20 family protein
MAANTLAAKNDEKRTQHREETRSNEKYIRPAVNILETEEALILTADMPGATKEGLEVNFEKGVLTISAQVSHNVPGQADYTEFELGNYYRQFIIPESLTHEKARADLKNGILTLRVPKAESARPQRIEVRGE